jgi:hypothetical protein
MRKILTIILLLCLSASLVQAQIVIGGNVYGGGNAGKTGGSTSVTICAGDINAVFGGARMANVDGSAFVHLDGAHATNDIVISEVYGGNDISGIIGQSDVATTVPTELDNFQKAGANVIDNSWKTFIRTSPCSEKQSATIGGSSVSADKYMLVVGSLYGGGNGDYVYKDASGNDLTDNDGNYIVRDGDGNTVATSTTAFNKPELPKTYLELKGGCIAHVYGGGNAATVTNNTTINIDNSSDNLQTAVAVWAVVNNKPLAEVFAYLQTKVKLSTFQSNLTSFSFHFARVFGGNNKAEMAIRPTWNLQKGIIRDLYSGGNQGAMSYFDTNTGKGGILLVVDPTNSNDLKIENVFGGCRMAAVNPNDNAIGEEVIDGVTYPAGYAARVLIKGGDITNVYGGNDISGNIFGGIAVGVHSSIKGDVYGGGNGSYAYTDNAELGAMEAYKDFYYSIPTGKTSVEALNAFRPNAESVSIRVIGTDADHPTVIGGAIYCGGNSATLHTDNPNKEVAAELKIGSFVIADKVFLGNNGENMVKTELLQQYAGNVTVGTTDYDFSQMNLASETLDAQKMTQFDHYMDGVAMGIKPRVVFDPGYEPYSTKFGSFYCGGNVGSMKIDGAMEVSFNDAVVIFDKVVGGSNMANVYKVEGQNAQYLGGLLGAPAPVPTGSPEGTIGNKLILNFGGLKIQPMRWIIERDANYEPVLDANGDEQYILDSNGNRQLEWNTVDSRTFDTTTKKYKPMASVAKDESKDYDEETDPYRRFQGGNIYGGCYSNGHVNGNVIINLNASLVDRKGENSIFDRVEENEGEAKLYNYNPNIERRLTGVLIDYQGMDPLGRALNVFGGGYGGDSEIWGSTTINLNAGYTFQIFGGGEQGAIGNAVSHSGSTLTYEYDERYSTYINLKDQNNHPGTYRGDTDNSDNVVDYEDMAEAEFIYGGSFEGLIAGSTHINLGNGRIFNSFAGSCNADILGHTETYVGRNSNDDSDLGFPWIRDHIYGGNDLGGRILNMANFMNRVSSDIQGMVYNPKRKTVSTEDSSPAPDPDVVKASAYTEYIQGRVEYIFGGCFGDYDYTDDHYSAYAYTTGSEGQTEANEGTMRSGYYKPWMSNAFVNFKPNNHIRNAVTKVYGAGQGHRYLHKSDTDRDAMQDRSYVLIDVSQNDTKYQGTEVFGAGDYSGVGMRNAAATDDVPALTPALAQDNADGVTASAVIDLIRGHLKDVYGASYKEGITRRTIVNVPAGSTIHLNRIFGGAYGLTNVNPCDVFEANINYNSADAIMQGYWIEEDLDEKGNLMSGGIYGGNNNARRTLYSKVNISSLVYNGTTSDGVKYSAKVFGAGYGKDTWAQYTEVNLKNGASVYEVYGGGYGGMVLNKQSVDAFNSCDVQENNATVTKTVNKYLPTGYNDQGLECYLVRTNPLGEKTNTNVYINRGAYVAGYCYGAGLGADATVSGTTYIGLHGGTVSKDLYAAGWGGPVYDKYNVANDSDDDNDFIATTNAYIEGGTVRNAYGGGYQGSVGYHDMSTTATTNDIPGRTNVVIGIRADQSDENLVNALKTTLGNNATMSDYNYYCGIPAVQRNAYGGGEGGSVFGTSNLTLRNGYIGYTYNSNGQYEEKVNDETWTDHLGLDRLSDCGNLFGGGYDDNSSVDYTNVTVWGGIIRNSVFGGGEIATIGRGKVNATGEDNKDRELEAIYMAGKTHITVYNGHIKRNVFGGGKGYNILGYGGTRGFYTDGYVFGGTEVFIHGGEIGTDTGLAEGYGNVFGGGDVGYVYSKGYFSTMTVSGKTDNPGGSTGSPNHWYYYDEAGLLTEDCKVVVAPMLQIRKTGTDVTYPATGDDQETYHPYDYVPTDYLNTLPADKTDSRWTNLYTGSKTGDDMIERGVHIHNAVFAGGNVSSNSESYNNATTVFGNTTAALYDVYHHDFITVGTEHTGGLYGGGNLSLVGGYRELNITNYGTDYYGLNQQISLDEYQTLSNRERAYFKLQYVCQMANSGHTEGERIDEDEYNRLPSDYKSDTYWKQYGFCSIYAGRLLNTIQRADFCGVFGSRLVLQGAKDRVADVADATEYTINRVGEVSLNQQRFNLNSETEIHGNYFGIYSVVNYMGNLTSDVRFDDPRRYVEGNETQVDTKDYYTYKVDNLTKRDRNNGTSYNQVALASGVFLELTTEYSTPSNKKYGDITGVVELDLINVKKDIEGGGYVYARNEHGERSEIDHFTNVLLSPYNKMKGNEARTKKIYEYSTINVHEWQTSGNFIHKSKRIVDDCYPMNGVYRDDKGLYKTSPAHYWFIKGEVYIYDQVVSAYAGSASAYSKDVKIPLTITAGSNGRLKLLNVQPNLYAYYADENRSENNKISSNGVSVDNERTTFQLNDVITWWDWNQLSDNEKKYFVKETYVNVDPCVIDGTSYEAGAYVLENDASVHGGDASQTAWKTFQTGSHTVVDSKGVTVTDLNSLFRSSNNISHETGYALTVDMNSPKDWDYWYSPSLQSNGGKISKAAYNELSNEEKAKYILGPTYSLTGSTGLYGQRTYSVGEVISKEVYDDYNNTVVQMSPQPEGQATAEPAYVATVAYGNTQAGSAIGMTEWSTSPYQSNYQPAMLCINTIQLGDEEYVLMGELVSGKEADLNDLANRYKTYNNNKINSDKIDDDGALAYIMDHLSPAYYIKSDGLYGGQYFQSGINYGAIKSWCSLTDARKNFTFNYDAFDVLVDSNYPGEGHTDVYAHPYDEVKSVEYDAVYNGTGTLTYYDNDGTERTISAGGSIDREAFEKVRNDQMHYTRISVDAGSDTQTVYIVNETIINKGTPYAMGQDISEKDYNNLTDENKAKVDVVTFQKGSETVVKYYCYENYTPLTTSTFTPESGERGKKGSIISTAVFTNEAFVPNYQKYFAIQGSEPTETTTLYVSRESNAKDVTKEKVISVVYQYTYYEPDDEGEGVSLVNELHVLNIHLQLESGAPEIGPLAAPPAVLPGNSLGMKAPSVNPGLYEILTSGWELFEDETDAQLHRNGTPFVNNSTPLYWYQNQKVWLAFYSKTYLGKTYSNYVPLTVANYHDIDAVMKDKEHHLYVDHPAVMRNSKIYIDNRECESDPNKSELDLLKDFFDLSTQTEVATSGATKDHALLDSHVAGGADLEFILNSDVSPKAYTNWTPVGDATQCFAGTLHGDGYTISGLNNSLFGTLCGSVYNLGVTGSFTSAGIVDTGDGYVENCWINTTGTPDAGVRAVFGNPTRESEKQIVNCYYPVGKNYSTSDNGRGLARQMTETQFYNGTVAFNLNGFYLNKRYYDKNRPSAKAYPYNYLKSVDGVVSDEMSTGYYPASPDAQYGDVGYVESRYADGDFVYAGGTIPEAYDERMRVVTDGTTSTVTYAPIWPDDYLYFGQMLTYGYNTSRPHQDLPTRIAKSEGRLPATNLNNRVYRAPAYYQSKEMNVAHFNLWANLAAKSAKKTVTDTDLKDAYPNMTAIDFFGHKDNTWALGFKADGFAAGSPAFYPPLLDDDEGLLSIVNNGETPNLLVYAPSAEVKASTCTVLAEYFTYPVYASYYTDDAYRCVGSAPTSSIHGHLVQSSLQATCDHLLVDKFDFNCPISYEFANGYRMWYQRTPDRYVSKNMGWETVSLPFVAELVTTQQKGEITHFYSGSRSYDDNGTKVGHEYWLREYKGGALDTNDATVFKTTFNYPTASGNAKIVSNTFLWDYYYSKNVQKDANTDTYQTMYYSEERHLAQYPLLAAGKPYIVGFPGTTYYEFDLSGEWEAKHTATPAPAKLDRQVITFASETGVTINVSDDELSGVAEDGYSFSFQPNYGSKPVEGYLLNIAGNSFDVTASVTALVPFRPYFVTNPTPVNGSRNAVRSIFFDSDDSSFAIGDEDPSKEEIGEGDLLFTIRKHEIAVTSSLRRAADVRIVNISGVTIANFTIQPGETIERYIPVAGVYIVRADGGRIQKKLAIR